MSSELLYTSAPKGLRQGSRGFCTVISSSGMPSNLATKLESLSGYRQMFAPESPEANQNPVAYSHMTVTVGGQKTSVLSRIAAYGTDYSGRTNKLAHHVVPDRSELTPAGPAWLLQQAGLMRTQWDGNCQTTASGPTVAMGNLTATKCNTWEQLTGDAGWAGALAQAWSQRQSKPIWLVYRLEDQNRLLPLLSEAIALLPENERWKATFNTYATQLPPDVQCRVRCVVDGTQDARMAKARGTVITLGQANGPAPTNDWSEIARGNQAPAPSPQPTPAQPAAGVGTGKTPPRKSPPTRAPKIPGLPPGKAHAQPALPHMPTAAEGTTPAHPAGSGAEPPAMRPPMTGDPQDYTHGSRGLEVIEPGPSPLGPFNQEPKRSKAPLLAAIAVVLIALIGGGIFLELKTGLVASLFPAPAENTEEGSETNEGSDKKDTKKKGKGADPDKNKKDNGKPTAKPTPPPLPKLTVAIKENGNEPFEEGATLIVRVTRDNKESGDGKTITLTNDEKDARVSFEPPEIKFSAEEDSKEIKLTIKDDEQFNPAELTITAQFKEDDDNKKKANTKLLVKDSKDLTIKLMDGESEATELTEGKSYQIECPESPNAIAPKISYKITPKEGIPAPAQYDLKQKLASLDEKESRLVLNETDEYRFADDFCKLSLVVSYEKNGKILGEKKKELPVKDNDPITRGLRWQNATATTVTKLVDESKPRIAVNKTKGEQPQIIWETNEWPAPTVEAKTSGLTGETIKLSSRGGQTFPLKTAKKTGQEYIIVKVSEKDSEYDAHLFSNEKSALAYIENPKAPSQPPSGRKIEKEFVAKAIAIDTMIRTPKSKDKKLIAYYYFPEVAFPLNAKPNIFIEGKDGHRTTLRQNDEDTSKIQSDIETLFNKDEDYISLYRLPEQEEIASIEQLNIMVFDNAYGLQITMTEKTAQQIQGSLASLDGVKNTLEELMSLKSTEIASAIHKVLTSTKEQNLIGQFIHTTKRGVNEKATLTSIANALDGKRILNENRVTWLLGTKPNRYINSTCLSDARKKFFGKYFSSGKQGSDLNWAEVTASLKKVTSETFMQEIMKAINTGVKQSKPFEVNNYFKLKKEKNKIVVEDTKFRDFETATTAQITAIQRAYAKASAAIKELQEINIKTDKTLVIEFGESPIRQPIAFKIQIK